ncbi:hypothetical protein BMS3Bbin15_00494 [archaeon BMS3Bbin15]|nr:hypothetical protein BMS3Bbin15_00494 [archaeon BMS3Bbin15]
MQTIDKLEGYTNQVRIWVVKCNSELIFIFKEADKFPEV